jgi:hypothetical protein
MHETSHDTSQRLINNGLSVYQSLKIYLQALEWFHITFVRNCRHTHVV